MEARFFFISELFSQWNCFPSNQPTSQNFPCWNLCLLPLTPLLCTSERAHLCCSPPKALSGCCEAPSEAVFLPGWAGSILPASLSWQGLQPQSSWHPSAQLTAFFESHFSLLGDVKLDTMTSPTTWRKDMTFHMPTLLVWPVCLLRVHSIPLSRGLRKMFNSANTGIVIHNSR